MRAAPRSVAATPHSLLFAERDLKPNRKPVAQLLGEGKWQETLGLTPT